MAKTKKTTKKTTKATKTTEATDERLTSALYLRVTATDLSRLEALVQLIPVASRNAIGRAAMRLGMDLLEKDPAAIFASPLPKRGRRKGR